LKWLKSLLKAKCVKFHIHISTRSTFYEDIRVYPLNPLNPCNYSSFLVCQIFKYLDTSAMLKNHGTLKLSME